MECIQLSGDKNRKRAAGRAATGAMLIFLWLGQRELGWVGRDWRAQDIPMWRSFALWQWTACASVWWAFACFAWGPGWVRAGRLSV